MNGGNKRLFLVICSVAFFASAALLAWPAFAYDDPDPWLRYPAVSPDGQTVAFCYMGDIWTAPVEGGRAMRLTVAEGSDRAPQWSPDGETIAFTSEREGSSNVYVVSAEGGIPKRVTYGAWHDRVYDWTPDGKKILFYGGREARWSTMQLIPADASGPPERVADYWAYQGKISPDGKKMVFGRGLYNWYRKGYRGSADSDVWITNIGGKPAILTQDFDGADDNPVWDADGEWIYFLSDRSGLRNIWKMKPDGSEKTQVTKHKKWEACNPAISRNANILVYERHDHLYVMELPDGKPKRISITALSDNPSNSVERRTYRNRVSDFALSPDNEQTAFIVHGEVFVVSTEGKKRDAMRITKTSAREWSLAWSPDGKKLAFLSDRDGEPAIYIVESSDPDEADLCKSLRRETKKIVSVSGDLDSLSWSPDGKRIAFIEFMKKLYCVDVETKTKKKVIENPYLSCYCWAPDGEWFAVQNIDDYWNSDIYIVSRDGDEIHNITQTDNWNTQPAWSDDGKSIAFLVYDEYTQSNLWSVYLNKEDDERDPDEEEDEKKPKEEKEEADKDKDKDKDKNKDDKSKDDKDDFPEITFDWDGIEERTRQITNMRGKQDCLALSPDGKTLAFVADSDGDNTLYTIDFNGESLTKIPGVDPSQICWAKDSQKIYYITDYLSSGGSISYVNKDGGDRGGVSFSAKMEVDHPAEYVQMYLESWRKLRDYFYDSDYHGVNWKAVRDKYLPLAKQARTQIELHDAISFMFGELNASHLGVTPYHADNGPHAGHLGVEFDKAWKGPGFKVSRIVKEGPAWLEKSKIEVGEIIFSIDGEQLIPGKTNIYKLLFNRVGEKTDLTVGKTPKLKEARRVIIAPIDRRGLGALQYKEWVEQRREIAERLSDGKIGYIHIKSMNIPSFEKFKREIFFRNRDKEAIVLDVRFNGGGWTHDLILNILTRKEYGYFMPRDGLKSPCPHEKWEKPIIVLCNEFSFSDAEIFPYGFQKLGVGKVVGVNTAGGVIGTGGVNLLDGSWLRLPRSGVYTIDDVNMENRGAIVDIHVDNPAEQDFDPQNDDQLARAVEELEKELKAKK